VKTKPGQVVILSWGDGARLVIDGLPHNLAAFIAERWGAGADLGPVERDPTDLRLVIPGEAWDARSPEPRRIRISVRSGSGDEPVEIRIGPHAVCLGSGGDPDTLRISSHRPPSAIERELLVDVAINHLLARQGRPVLHACAFELGGTGIVGLGESFAGKTTVAMAAMRAGGRVISDDLVLASPASTGRIALFPLRTFGWLRGKTRDIVPHELREKMRETEEGGEPRWVLSREHGGRGFIGRSEVQVMWVLSVDRRLKESRIAEIDQGKTFAALIRASSPVFLSRHCPEERDALIQVLRALSETCRSFRVRLGRRLLDDPEAEMARLIKVSAD
jgi:hypothetical protein